jgi:anti-sigma factor RsiW
MRCDSVAEQLLAPDRPRGPELEQHVSACPACAHLARGLARLDMIAARSVLVEPPLDVQRRLAELALEAARPRARPWWQRLMQGELNFDWLVLRPNVVAAQGLAAVMVVLASWQVFGWLSLFRPVIGDVGYAVQLVVASPAVAYLGGLQVDLGSLALWSLVGIAGWLVSEHGALGRRLASLTDRLRLP